MCMVVITIKTDTSSSGLAIMDKTRSGLCLPKELNSQNIHSRMARVSKSDLKWLEEEHSSGMRILELTSTDSESETLTQETTDNGLYLTGELDLLELNPTESLQFHFQSRPTTGFTGCTQLLSDHSTKKTSRESDGSRETRETSEISVTDASMSMEEPINTTNTLSGTNATTVKTKHGLLTPRVSSIQNSHLLPELSSNLDQEWLNTEPLLMKQQVSDKLNTDSEFKIITQMTLINGGYSIQGLTPLDQLTTESMFLQTSLDKASRLMLLQLLDHTQLLTLKESNGTLARSRTLETTVENALMSMVELHKTNTGDTSSSTIAIMEEIKLGSSIKEVLSTQNKLFQMERDSKLEQEWLVEELSHGTNTLVDTNTESEFKTMPHGMTDSGSPLIREQSQSDASSLESTLSPTELDGNTDQELWLL